MRTSQQLDLMVIVVPRLVHRLPFYGNACARVSASGPHATGSLRGKRRKLPVKLSHAPEDLTPAVQRGCAER